MSEELKNGAIVWHDLTVPNAAEVRDFYKEVIGWESGEVDMKGYADYTVHLSGSEGEEGVVGGVCHARGSNANLPPQWLMYVKVPDVDAAAERCIAQGGKVLDGPRQMGANRFAAIQDPAGAVLAIIS